MKSKLLLCIGLCLYASLSFCQANLVPNGSFENGSCVVNYNSTPAKIPTTIDHWYSCTGASPDPFDTCGTMMPAAYDIIVPDILNGYQTAHTGARFMGLGYYTSWYEYIGTKLTEPLEAGETYTVSFWVSCADMMLWATKDIGIYFSTSEISFPSTNVYGTMLNYTPQFVHSGDFLKDTVWREVKGEFVAAGGEQWIVMGYFKPMNINDFYLFPDPGDGRRRKANPDYKPTVQGTGTTTAPRAYYYIDDVVISKKQDVLPIRLSTFSGKLFNQQVVLNWKTETETNNCRFEIERSANGRQFTAIGTVPGAINSATPREYSFIDPSPLPGSNYYRLRQVDCDGVSAYSKTIILKYELNGFTMYPNPVTDILTIDRNRPGKATAIVFDPAGRVLLTQTIQAQRTTIATDQLLPGAYIIRVENESGSFTQKFIKK